ncbi:MAG: UDP-N-acetylmuramoyl-L-alanyl-D-glutamate--2,6-diaminopimelate ligase, partial [bacterium]|nr:UDP-N-acetylmuramoyl-L-alanyl-D-glutamate--2,6-diaminopimelate ligase [bacterium]
IIACSGNLDTTVSGITNDSRKVKKNSCFVAIKGFKEDGDKYIADALKKGATSIVSESFPDTPPEGMTWIQVKNDRFILSKMAARYYDRVSDRMYTVGVTGTNAKTTITTLVNAIYNRKSPTALMGTLGMRFKDNTETTGLTTPEAVDIFRYLSDAYREGCENLVMEVSSVALRLYRVEDVTFSQAIFTTFSGDHLDFHGTMEEYLESKILLFN